MTDASLDPTHLTRHAAALRRVALALVRDASKAEDVLQNAYLTALERPARHRSLPWLIQVVRSRALDLLRRERSRSEHERLESKLSEEGNCEPVSERLETFALLVQTIASLPDNLQEALYLRYFDGLTPTEIAARCGAPVKTIKTRLSRALLLMREKLGKHFGEEAGGWHGLLLAPLGLDKTGGIAAAAKAQQVIPSGLLWLSGTALLGIALTASLVLTKRTTAGPTVQSNDASGTLVVGSPENKPTRVRTASAGSESLTQIAGHGPSNRKRAAVGDRSEEEEGASESSDEENPHPKERIFWCKLVDDDSGSPVEGGRIAIKNVDTEVLVRGGSLNKELPKPKWRDPWKQTESSRLGGISISDAQGHVQVRSRWDSLMPARVDAEGYGPLLLMPPVGRETREEALVLRVKRAAELQVRLIDDRGTPMRDIRIVAEVPVVKLIGRRDTYLQGKLLHWEGHTDMNGSYTLRAVPAGQPVSVQAWRGEELLRETSQDLRFVPGEARKLSWTIQSGVQVEGFLLDHAGVPYTDHVVWLAKGGANMGQGRDRFYFRYTDKSLVVQSTTTDDLGHFVFEQVRPGTWYIGPRPGNSFPFLLTGEKAAPIAKGVEVGTQGVDSPLTLRVERGLFIRGSFSASPGERGSSNWASANSEFGRLECLGTASTFTASSPTALTYSFSSARKPARFRFGPLEPGTYELRAKVGGSLGPSIEVEAPADDVVLELAASGKLSAKWIHPVGKTACHGSILVSQPGARTPSSGSSVRFDAYKLVATAFTPGTYNVVVCSEDGYVGYSRDLEVRAGMFIENTPVQLGDGASIALHYNGSIELATYAVYQGDVLVSYGSIRKGATLLRTVPPGALTVEFRQGDKVVFERELHLQGGEEAFVTFQQD